MTDQSNTPPQVETVDVPPNPEILLGWARRLFETEPEARVSVGVISPEWEHQRVLWLKSFEMYRDLPQPEFEGAIDEVRTYDHALSSAEALAQFAPEITLEGTLTLLPDVGPILGAPSDTGPDRAVALNHVLAEWWANKRTAPLVLPFPVGVKDLR